MVDEKYLHVIKLQRTRIMNKIMLDRAEQMIVLILRKKKFNPFFYILHFILVNHAKYSYKYFFK